MSGTFIAGIIVVVTVYFTLCRTAPLKRWLGYSTWLDLSFTVFMLWAFHDTYSGIVAAAFAGLFMAVSLTVMRRLLGYQRLKMVRNGWRIRWEWRDYPPKWRKLRFPKFKLVRVT